jgi:putative ATPase
MTTPLAARLRPTSFDEFFGQTHLVGPGMAFRRAAEAGKLGSVILWGPPGVGKTTLAEIVARLSGAKLEKISAVTAGVADLRRITEEARKGDGPLFGRRPTILFIDEIHRFNKSQQDAILPFVEDGTVTLIGATTENPSFEVNPALRSRARVYTLNPLSEDELRQVLARGMASLPAELTAEAEELLLNLSNGDARSLLNMYELVRGVNEGTIDTEAVRNVIHDRAALYDKNGEEHYNLISALHKTVRGSDVDASLYWLARMLENGEDPLYLARRIVRMANEDIGLADPMAMLVCIAARDTVQFIGMPEGALALAEAVAYLALAPKSNAVYAAYKAAVADVKNTRHDGVPLHLRNAPTGLMKELGYGKGYKYAHDFEGGLVGQSNLPEPLEGREYYHPTDRGREAKYQERMAEIRAAYAAREASDIDPVDGS